MRQAILADIRTVAGEGDYLVSTHFLDMLFERGLDLVDIADAIREDAPEIIEDYPNDTRGSSCLILCQGASGTWYHVVCGYAPLVTMITVYVPDSLLWSLDYRRGRRP